MELVLVQTEEKPCPKCGKPLKPDEVKTHEDKYFCETCFNEIVLSCASCHKPVWRDETREVKDGKKICDDCFSEDYRICDSCDGYFLLDEVRYSEIHEAYYCSDCESRHVVFCRDCGTELDPDQCMSRGELSFCEECYNRVAEDNEFIQNHEFSSKKFRRSKSKRKYGVEIEAILDEGGSHLPVEELGAWSKQKDGSLGESGMEFASPILQGDDGFCEIERFTHKLMLWHYLVDKRCGLHVHIDGRDLVYQDIKRLLKIALSFEAVIYAMLPESRYTGSFSVPLGRFPKSRFKFKVEDEEGLKRLWYGRRNAHVNTKSKFHHSRYFGVNIHSWFFRRSIEFRYHSGTLNPLKITNFIKICQALVDRAKKLNDFRFAAYADFNERYQAFLKLMGISCKLDRYIRARILKFHPDRFRAAPVLQASLSK